jgi:hypothetical protein
MQTLGYDLMRDSDAASSELAGAELQLLSLDAVRYGCLVR